MLDVDRIARDRALQAALAIPLLASAFEFATSFRMVRLPDIAPSASLDEAGFG